MDIIERHFAAENARDVPATLATYTDDLVWDDVANPDCPVYGKSAAAEIYQGIMDAIPDIHLDSIGRFSCGDHVVDESIVTGHIRGWFIGIDGGGAPVRFRMLHVFDIATASSAASRPGSTRRESSARWSLTGTERRRRAW